MNIVSKMALVAMALIASTPAYADDALRILKAMSDYVAAQKNISASYNSDVDVVTSSLQKITFASSGKLVISRPDKIYVTRTGGFADVVMNFDGKTFTILGKNLNAYTQIDSPGTIDNLVDRIRDNTTAEFPGADIFSANAYGELTEGLLDSRHIGRGVVNGVPCDLLAFRTPDVDWQIWVQVGDKPIPRKYVITSKTVAQAPEYTIMITDWRTDAPADANQFVFNPPKGATKVAIEQMQQTDEAPPGVLPDETKKK
ncbi:MAG TPA: DUF2092 domain-containing protein [Rhizomicrobium sp.]|nr:DUF2092 domain-containing protein [Rhizomicrobium sp.]